MVGHMRVQKTIDQILVQFYWPDIDIDIAKFCKSCDICQKTTPKGRVTKVPLDQMPVIDEPFKRIAVNLIEPIHPISEKETDTS